MNLKKVFIVIFALSLTMTACSSNSQNSDNVEHVRSVKTTEVKKESYPVKISYIGTVTSKDIKKYSFKSSAKIASVNVVSGTAVKKGDVLVNLDTNDLKFSVNAAKAQMESAEAQYKKALNGALQEDIKTLELNVKQAQDAYDFAADLYDTNVKLFDKGGISQFQLDQSKLQMDNAKDTLNQGQEALKKVQSGSRPEDITSAKSQYEGAKTNYQANLSLLEDAVLKSDVDGYIIEVLYKEGEMVPAGYPVVVVRSEIQTITIGMSQKDVKQIHIGDSADVSIDGNSISGVISDINQIPDEKTLTYKVEVDLQEKSSDKKIYIGSIAKVNFTTHELEGVWVDIPIIMNDGQDYVYVIENDRVIKRIVQLGDIHEDKVSVLGLEPGSQLVIEGSSNIKEGYKVAVVN